VHAAPAQGAERRIVLNTRDLDGSGERATLEPEARKKRRREPTHRGPKSTPARKALAFVAGAGLALLGAAIVKRDEVVRSAPDLVGLYALVGLPVQRSGLEFGRIASHEGLEKGMTVLVVDGSIVNTAPEATPLPPIALTVRDAGGAPLHTWTIKPAKDRAESGETVAFHAALASPPVAAREVFLRFAPKDGRAAP